MNEWPTAKAPIAPKLPESTKKEGKPWISVEDAFRKFNTGLDIKSLPDLKQRLYDTGEHFQDAVEMAEIIDRLFPKLGLPPEGRNKLIIATLCHDVGKAGPALCSPEAREEVKRLFPSRSARITETTTVDQFAVQERLDEHEHLLRVFAMIDDPKSQAQIDPEKMTIREFWNLHSYWTYEILQRNQGSAIDDEVINIAASHHYLDGVNPANLTEDEVPDSARTLELVDKYTLLTIVDKYQAFRDRSAMSHEETIGVLRGIVGKTAKNRAQYERIIDILADAERELMGIIE